MAKKKATKKPKEKVITPLERIMFEKQITLEALKEESGLSHDVLSKIKNGKRENPNILTMKKIVDAINGIAGTEYKIDDLIV